MLAKLTTHVLDTTNGCPARDLQLELWSLAGEQRTLLKRAQTNADGRLDEALLTGAALAPGEYELVFFVGDYFAAKGLVSAGRRFLDRVPVRFGVGEFNTSYHVPLLCSPWAYSTYRGS